MTFEEFFHQKHPEIEAGEWGNPGEYLFESFKRFATALSEYLELEK